MHSTAMTRSSRNGVIAISSASGNNLEALSGDRIGEHSIRINDQYRICFKWTTNGPYQVEITDYH